MKEVILAVLKKAANRTQVLGGNRMHDLIVAEDFPALAGAITEALQQIQLDGSRFRLQRIAAEHFATPTIWRAKDKSQNLCSQCLHQYGDCEFLENDIEFFQKPNSSDSTVYGCPNYTLLDESSSFFEVERVPAPLKHVQV